MRFAIAIAVLALSGIAFVLGIGQRTFLAPPEAVTVSVAGDEQVNLAVIPAELFTRVAGAPTVTVRGEDTMIATGSARDVAAWTEAFDHAEVDFAGGSAGNDLVFTTVPGVTSDSDAPATDDAAQTDTAEAEAAPAEGGSTDPYTSVGLIDPRGSDLWVMQSTAAEVAPDGTQADHFEARLSAFSTDAEQFVLVATPDEAGLGEALTVTWTQDQSTPLAGPLLVAGGVLALVGAVLYLLAIDHRQKGLGPQRGRSGPLQGIRGSMSRRKETRKMKRIAVPALMVAGALGLSGCSADYWPDFTGTPETVAPELSQSPDFAPVPITQTQIDRILDDIDAVADAADESLDASLLTTRFTGDALTQREANFTIRAAVPDYALVPPHITDTQLGYDLVQSTQGWPRPLSIALESEGDEEPAAETTETTEPAETAEGEATAEAEDEQASPSLALVMTQASPHDNYLVSRVINLRGGITMPEAAPADEGTALLAPDLQTLVLPPGEVAPAFAAVLQGGLEVPEAASFSFASDDSLVARSGIAWVQQAQERAAAEGFSINYSVSVRAADTPITALSVSNGGALVAVTVIEDRASDTAGSTTRVRAEGAVSALSGLTGQQERLVNTVAHQLLFYVPSKTSGEQIQLLGATSELVGASN